VLTPDHVWTVPVSGGAPTDRTPKLGASATSLIRDARGNVWVLVERGVRRDVSTLRDGQLTTAFGWSDGVVELPIGTSSWPGSSRSPARGEVDEHGGDYLLAGAVPTCTGFRSNGPLLSTKNTQSAALSQDVVCR